MRMMSEDVGGGGEGRGGGGGGARGGGNLWVDQSHLWPGFSTSDMISLSSENITTMLIDKSNTSKMNLQPLDSGSNTPTPAPTPTQTTIPPLTPTAGHNQTPNNKRSRSGGVHKGTTGKGKADVSGHDGSGGAGGGCGGESDHDIHIWTERERRKKMRDMFSNLHALLPQLPPKADKSTIVDEAVNYIKTLQYSLQKLQKQRLEMLTGRTISSTIIIDHEPSSSLVLASTAPPLLNSCETFLVDQGSSNRNITTSMSNMNSQNILDVPAIFQTWSSPNVVLNVNGVDAQISVCTPKKPGLLSSCLYALEKHNLEVVTAQVSSDFYRSMFMIHCHANGAYNQFLEPLAVEEIYKLAAGEMIFLISSS